MVAIPTTFKLLLLLVYSVEMQIIEDVNKSGGIELHGRNEILSRKKRFIIFPEGSSFQLGESEKVNEFILLAIYYFEFYKWKLFLFCTTFPLVSPIGDIVLWGYTAALAWELPQDPYSPFDHHADPLHRRMDSKVVYYTDEDGKVIYRRPYKRKAIVNPAFAKRSVDVDASQIEKEKYGIDRKQMHASKNRRAILNSTDYEQQTVEFHRTSRVSLYQKIETMLQGLGANGKHCMLKTLCIVGKTNDHPQGAFLQEILRAVFTLPQGGSDEFQKEYEAAHYAKESCDELYPDCDQTVLEANYPTLNY
ncbi:uncharacterized protein LOC101745712 [Bombyx mori]|uniref:uncharacterized protein LOC101745712 n=1 Tax=Bombyx mori TaxID=7091 RepID=UPI002ED20CB0